jgi:5-methyltetrahydrofolate--homocysteine methyltransferase
MSNEITDAIAELRKDDALKLTQERLDNNEDPQVILEEGRQGMEIIGKRFADGEYFLPELIYSGEIFSQVSELVKPKLKAGMTSKKLGKVIIGTVAGDIHDIGKDIVVFMLDVSGFEVYDLGIDVPAENFIEKIKEIEAPIVGLSGFLTLAFESMKDTIDLIVKEGLRDKVKIMIGGGQIDESIRKYSGADAYGKDAMTAVALAKGWLEEE